VEGNRKEGMEGIRGAYFQGRGGEGKGMTGEGGKEERGKGWKGTGKDPLVLAYTPLI